VGGAKSRAAAATLAGFALSRGQHLPQKAADCAQLAEASQPPPPPGLGLGEVLGALLPQMIDIDNRGATGDGGGWPPPEGGTSGVTPRGGVGAGTQTSTICSQYSQQLQGPASQGEQLLSRAMALRTRIGRWATRGVASGWTCQGSPAGLPHSPGDRCVREAVP
jgi:hypothetical protein